ncbi:MAG: hypothetical protein IJ111_01100 [Eggerthellaceae bacterium]|nr:hypothetical protein [Eggerthellaceae bacterium]
MGKPRYKSVRNSTADFLMFALDGQGEGIQVVVEDETVWLTQKAMATLFDCSVANKISTSRRCSIRASCFPSCRLPTPSL